MGYEAVIIIKPLSGNISPPPPSMVPWSHRLLHETLIKQTSKNQPYSIFNTDPHGGQPHKLGMSELLNHTCSGRADRVRSGLGERERERERAVNRK